MRFGFCEGIRGLFGLLFILMLEIPNISSVYWNWILSQNNLSNEQVSQMSTKSSESASNRTAFSAKTNILDSNQAIIAVFSTTTDKIMENNSEKLKETIHWCTDDRQCDSNSFCDTHYNLCKRYKMHGQTCRHDSMCQNKLRCIFGRCQIPSKLRHKGAKCNSGNDCLPGLCCARQHGELICKAKLKQGQNCFVPDGGLPYWLNELCPCDLGLVCRNKTIINTPDHQEESFEFWLNRNTIRCVSVDIK